jgi:hypothetical protein
MTHAELERENAEAAEAVRQLRDEHGLDYSYAVTARGTLLDLELPVLPWMPPKLMDVLWRWNAASKESGFAGLQGVLVPHPATTERLVGAACSEWIRCLIVGRSLIEFSEALEAKGLRWLTISVEVREGGDLLFAKALSVDDGHGHIGWLWDVPVVSKRRRGGEAEWRTERLVEQLRGLKTGGSGDGLGAETGG